MPQDFSEDDWIYACHTFRGFRVFIHGGLYVPGECGTIPLSSVERLVIVRKGRHSKGLLYTNVPADRRCISVAYGWRLLGGVPRVIPLGIPVASTEHVWGAAFCLLCAPVQNCREAERMKLK